MEQHSYAALLLLVELPRRESSKQRDSLKSPGQLAFTRCIDVASRRASQITVTNEKLRFYGAAQFCARPGRNNQLRSMQIIEPAERNSIKYIARYRLTLHASYAFD